MPSSTTSFAEQLSGVHVNPLERRVPLGMWPSPVQSLPDLREGLWVKDDGVCHEVYGGNKVRKLEYLLAGAEKRIVTFGAMGSHHALATAVHATARGHQVVVVNHPRHHTPHAEAVLRATLKLAEVHRFDSHEDALIALQELGEGATVIPAGGSTPIGALGFVRASLELADQISAGLLPVPRRIFVAAGSAGTLAGLAVGLKLAGLETRVIGVRVVPEAWMSRDFIQSLCDHTAALLGMTSGQWTIEDRWLGAGYSATTPEAEDALARAGSCGLHLETCYTAKALAAALAADGPGPDLFWQTHNQAVLDPLLESAPLANPAQWPWQALES